MKTSIPSTVHRSQFILLLGLFAMAFLPTSAAPAEPVVVERGPHHRVVQRVVTEPQPDGTTAERISRFTELATGFHYWQGSVPNLYKLEIDRMVLPRSLAAWLASCASNIPVLSTMS